MKTKLCMIVSILLLNVFGGNFAAAQMPLRMQLQAKPISPRNQPQPKFLNAGNTIKPGRFFNVGNASVRPNLPAPAQPRLPQPKRAQLMPGLKIPATLERDRDPGFGLRFEAKPLPIPRPRPRPDNSGRDVGQPWWSHHPDSHPDSAGPALSPPRQQGFTDWGRIPDLHEDPFGGPSNTPGDRAGPFDGPSNPFGDRSDPFGGLTGPFGEDPGHFGGLSNPFGDRSGPFGDPSSPFGDDAGPFGGLSNPFGDHSGPFGDDSGPFGGGPDPFGDSSNPFGDQPGPFGGPGDFVPGKGPAGADHIGKGTNGPLSDWYYTEGGPRWVKITEYHRGMAEVEDMENNTQQDYGSGLLDEPRERFDQYPPSEEYHEREREMGEFLKAQEEFLLEKQRMEELQRQKEQDENGDDDDDDGDKNGQNSCEGPEDTGGSKPRPSDIDLGSLRLPGELITDPAYPQGPGPGRWGAPPAGWYFTKDPDQASNPGPEGSSGGSKTVKGGVRFKGELITDPPEPER
jgi:hypothetical protein